MLRRSYGRKSEVYKTWFGCSRALAAERIRAEARGGDKGDEATSGTNLDDPSAEERFKKIQQTYEVLSNSRKRREHYQSSRAYTGRSSGRTRAEASGGCERRTTFSVELSIPGTGAPRSKAF